ncbi:MAG TPA: tryptophan synthase subunit alpha [Arenimonas sp.]|uniref:tryptophan synthase subunit alpha n=1 Tax=Arenimonas sp. TaxID=1872635 RepID=UPI002D7EC360|nr:tryptophan synthase subunit alpha [Arenimonas sp.]HEU0151849.1 tryptophan synthase subunit alpha [Arenimonas sp.]
MSRIAAKFRSLAEAKRKALVPFVTAGDPSLEATVPVMHALVAAGADVIELGVPFSDPMADGPVIQRSSERAIERGAGVRYILAAVAEFRRVDAETPVVLMGYLNPVEMWGAARFAEAAAEAGVDGVLLVDLPPEEAGPTRDAFNAAGLDLISLAAPTTTPDRLARLATESQGYLYYVSFAGVTGGGQLDTTAVLAKAGDLRRQAKVPVLVGFGIRDAASAAALAPAADGIVVGSALVDALAGAATPADAAARAGAFLAPLRGALDAHA